MKELITFDSLFIVWCVVCFIIVRTFSRKDRRFSIGFKPWTMGFKGWLFTLIWIGALFGLLLGYDVIKL